VRAVLPDPEPPQAEGSSGKQDNGTGRPDDELALIAPPAYLLALCDVRVPDGGGMVRCPLTDHDDAYASCQVYAQAEQGWVVLPLLAGRTGLRPGLADVGGEGASCAATQGQGAGGRGALS
jgi:hypothetical protein